MEASFHDPPIPHCVIRKFGYLQILVYLPLELCPKLRSYKISPGMSIALSTKLVDRRRLVLGIYDNRRVVIVYFHDPPIHLSHTQCGIGGSWKEASMPKNSWSVVTLQLHYLAGIVVQLVSTILTIFIDRASRGPSAVAELLVEN